MRQITIDFNSIKEIEDLGMMLLRIASDVRVYEKNPPFKIIANFSDNKTGGFN